MKYGLIIIFCVTLVLGASSTPLLTRLYFTKGGGRIWFISFINTAGCPIILIPLYLLFLRRRKLNRNGESTEKTKIIFMDLPLFAVSIFIGLLTGLDNYLYAYGVAFLPVSTSSLIVGSQLGFNAIFCFLMVKQKFTPFSINAVVLLTLATGILALHTSGDKPAHETQKQYVVGFILTLIAAALYAFILPLIELTYKKARQEITITLILEIQMVMCMASNCFCLVGMIIHDDFKGIPTEAREIQIKGPICSTSSDSGVGRHIFSGSI